MNPSTTTLLNLTEAPPIPGLTFRNYRGESDLPGMLAVLNAARRADHDEQMSSLEDLTNTYTHLTNCDPQQDVLIAEIGSHMIAYGRVTWFQEQSSGERIFVLIGFVQPAWRRKGIGRAMLRHNQRRLAEIASQFQDTAAKFFQSEASNFQPGGQRLLEQEGYLPARYGYIMTCTGLSQVPNLPLPEGLEVRLVKPEQFHQIWDAFQEAFRDHWGYVEPQESDYQVWLREAELQHPLWQVAWEGDQIAGMVCNFIGHDEDGKLDQKRAWTEGISVRRPWRRRGLARALLAKSMRMFHDMGFVETALGVDAQNPNGALTLYQSMGYQVIRESVVYRKEMK